MVIPGDSAARVWVEIKQLGYLARNICWTLHAIVHTQLRGQHRVDVVGRLKFDSTQAEFVVISGTLNFLALYNALITARILLSWFPQAQGQPLLQPLFVVTDPFLNLFRGLGLNFGGLDFSILPAFFLLNALTNAVPALGADPSMLM